MINRWKPYPKYKPTKRGWYQCTVVYGEHENQSYVMDLFYIPTLDAWKDNRRQDVFNIYSVFSSQTIFGPDSDIITEKEKITSDDLCYRDNVVAFKELPKVYKVPKSIKEEKIKQSEKNNSDTLSNTLSISSFDIDSVLSEKKYNFTEFHANCYLRNFNTDICNKYGKCKLYNKCKKVHKHLKGDEK